MKQTCTQVTIIRHGETQWNLERRYQGQLDSPLTARGVAQALATGAALKGEIFDYVYCSDLGRTIQTAALIIQPSNREIIPEIRLRERCLGLAQGLSRTEFKIQYPELEVQHASENIDLIIPGGESIRQCANRVENWMTDLALCHPNQRILAVTHGLILSYILKRVLSIPLDAPRRFRLDNAAINRFTIHDGIWFLESWGENEHTRKMIPQDEL